MFPISIGFERVVVDTTEAENNDAGTGRTPGIHIEGEDSFFAVLSFFGGDSESGGSLDNVTSLEVFGGKNAAAFVAGVFDFNTSTVTFHGV